MEIQHTNSAVLAEKETASTHTTKSVSGVSFNSLHPEAIVMISRYLSTRDCMSLSLTNHRCQRAVRHILLQDSLIQAIDDGNLSRVKTALKDGAIVHFDIPKNGNSYDHPLIRAVLRGQFRITKTLLNELEQEHHRVPFEQRRKLETAAFMVACYKGAEELVEYSLVMRKIDIKDVSNAKVALRAAVEYNQAGVVELLLEAGARPTLDNLKRAYHKGFADVASHIVRLYPDVTHSCTDNEFLRKLHAMIDEALDKAKNELSEYMRIHDLGTIV